MFKALENKFRLSERVSILIPDKDNVNQPLSEALLKETVSLVAKALAQIAGGSTVVPNLKGYYYTEEGILCEETTTEVQAYTTPDKMEQVLEKALELAEQVKVNLRQESVGLKVNDQFYFI